MKLTRTTQDVKEQAKCDALKPTEAMLKGKQGYRRFHHVDRANQLVKMGTVPESPKVQKALGIRSVRGEHASGYYEYAERITTNVDGKLTREAQESIEQMRPHNEANLRRQASLNGAPGSYGGRGRWNTRTVYHTDGSKSEYRRGA